MPLLKSAGFFVERVPLFPLAILLKFDPVARCRLVLHRVVVASFAFLALQDHFDSFVRCHFGETLSGFGRINFGFADAVGSCLVDTGRRLVQCPCSDGQT